MVASHASTGVLDLNDDCLVDVFEYLHLIDLATIADVCTRFRDNAQAQFRRSRYKEFALFDDIDMRGTNGDPLSHKSMKMTLTARILRNFGSSIETVSLRSEDNPCIDNKCIEQVTKYCSGSLAELTIHYYEITDDMALNARTLFSNLQKLKLVDCEYTDFFLNVLPKWAPQLRELFLSILPFKDDPIRFDGSYQTFPNLVCISLQYMRSLRSSDIDEFLKRNPQLEEIELVHTGDPCNLRSIAEYIPEIEAITFQTRQRIEPEIAKCLGNLRKLRSFGSCCTNSSEFTSSFLHEICASNIPLENLDLQYVDVALIGSHGQFMDNISKLKTLRRLRLCGIKNLSSTHVLDICENLKGLTELIMYCSWESYSSLKLLELIQNAKNLQVLCIVNRKEPFISTETYKKLVEIVEQRYENRHLELVSNATATVSAALTSKHKYSVNYTPCDLRSRSFFNRISQLIYGPISQL